MSSSSSAAIAREIADYESMMAGVKCGVAVTMLLLYDAILNLGREYQYIWRPPKSWVSRALYVLNRYMTLFYNLLALGTIPRLSDTSCTTLVWLIQSVIVVNFIGPAMFTTLRIYALSSKNKILGGISLVLSLVPFAINATTAYLKPPINLPPPANCTQYTAESFSLFMGLTIASRSCLILVDSLAVAVTWRHTHRRSVLTTGTRKLSLEQVMWQNGSLYFCILVLLNVASMALVIASTAIDVGGGGPAASYVHQFIDPVSSILNSRFLLALHETNARLAESAGSMSSLSFNVNNESDTLRNESPELQGYLRPLGGPIRSFYDDEDAGSLDFVSPSQGEHESDIELGIVENAGAAKRGGDAEGA